MSPVRDDAATASCPMCSGPFTPDGRQRYCSTLCRQRAWRRRQETPRHVNAPRFEGKPVIRKLTNVPKPLMAKLVRGFCSPASTFLSCGG